MTINEKNEIARLRKAGKSVNDIADELKLSRNTVKSFCRRNNLTGPADQMPDIIIPDTAEVKPCLHCGKPVVQTPDRKEKKFCNDICRNRFWNSHLAQVKRKAMYEYSCPTCGNTFFAYGNRNRKYCSHECYIQARFGGAACE